MIKTAPKKASRNRLIALIHVAKKELALNEESYRALLDGATGKTSLKEMGNKDLKAVIERFKEFGFKKSKPKRAGKRKMAAGVQASLIRALWLSLYQLGQVRDPSEEAIAAYVRRMAKVDAVQFLTPSKADAVIAGLRSWMKRAGYERPGEQEYKVFSVLNCNNQENLANAQAILHAAHVVNAQVQILGLESLSLPTHPYTLSADELYVLAETYGRMIRSEGGHG